MQDSQEKLEIIKITERLQEHCSCFDCEDGATMQTYVDKFLRVLARMLCWTDGECGSLLKSNREEIIEVDEVQLCGCDAIVEVIPFYSKGFDPSTLKVYLHKRKGFEREEYELKPSKFNYSKVDNSILINVTDELSPCCRCCDCCSCESQYKVILTYDAGYTSSSIPDCIFDVLCHFLSIFIAYQNNCGSLDDCANMDRLAVGSVLKKKSVDYIVREWEVDKTSIDIVYKNLLTKWYLSTLSSMSLCKAKNFTDNLYLSVKRRKGC